MVSSSRTVGTGNFPCVSHDISLQMHDLVSAGNFHKLVKMAVLNSRV